MGKKYQLEWDHIFPYSILKENGYSKNNRIKYSYAQEVTNRAVLTEVANRTKFTKPAEGYLAGVEKNFPEALALQSIPNDHKLWRLESFEAFLEKRRGMLAEELNTFLESIIRMQETEIETPLEELIAEGEDDELEFKASLRWSY